MRSSIAIGAALVVVALGFKHAYATAGADALGFILVPSCVLARDLGGVALTHEPGAGFITHAPRMIVGPTCSGLTFLVVAWLAFYFHVQGRLRTVATKLAWACVCALLAYVVTIATNATRIVLAAQLYDAQLYSGAITKAGLHRVLGVVLYCSTLLVCCQLLDRWSQPSGLRLPPLGWYLAVVLLVPALHYGTGQAPAQFAEHARVTLVTTVTVAVISWGVRRVWTALFAQRQTPPRSATIGAP